MKKWVVIDDCTSKKSRSFDHILEASSRIEAVKTAKSMWDNLTEREKKRRDSFYVGYAEVDRGWIVNLDTMTDIFKIKYRGFTAV